MKKLKISIFLMILGFGIVQAQEEFVKKNNKPISVELHYTGNFRNENGFSESYNGIAGLNINYKVVSGKVVNFQGGFSFDYFKGRDFKESKSVEYNNAMFFNPNLGVEFNINNSGFKPFFNLGYSFNIYSYTLYGSGFSVFDPSDPTFSGSQKFKYNENDSALSIQPGARFYFKNSLFIESSYRYLPIESNVNVHLFNLGLGVNF